MSNAAHHRTSRTYSEFFASGLRAMTGSPRPQTRTAAHVCPEEGSPNALKTSARYNVLRSLARRSRTSSSPSPWVPQDLPEKCAAPTRQQSQRRASIIDLPARLLGRVLQSDTRSLPEGTKAQRRQSVAGVYLARPSLSYDQKADPFGASPYSSSFFTADWADDAPQSLSLPPSSTPPSPRHTRQQRRQSLFHLGEPTYLRLPLPLPRNPARDRRRRNSVQSLPVTVPSRPSTTPRQFAFQLPLPALDKHDAYEYERAWPRTLDEEEETWSDDSDTENNHDPVGSIDWRQFHTELLRDEL